VVRPAPAWIGFPAQPDGHTDRDLNQPRRRGTCGHCTRCLDACPTGALVAPYVLDARRCISYLTIELKGPIPRDLRPLMDNRIFGCDICQEVCPWNRRFALPTLDPAFQPGPDGIAPRLLDLISLDEEGFRRRFRGSPLKRAKRRGLLRNVAVALGNWGNPAAVPALARAQNDPEPLVRDMQPGHWAVSPRARPNWLWSRPCSSRTTHGCEQKWSKPARPPPLRAYHASPV
jgi:epoxyqueuosine reductase